MLFYLIYQLDKYQGIQLTNLLHAPLYIQHCFDTYKLLPCIIWYYKIRHCQQIGHSSNMSSATRPAPYLYSQGFKSLFPKEKQAIPIFKANACQPTEIIEPQANTSYCQNNFFFQMDVSPTWNSLIQFCLLWRDVSRKNNTTGNFYNLRKTLSMFSTFTHSERVILSPVLTVKSGET